MMLDGKKAGITQESRCNLAAIALQSRCNRSFLLLLVLNIYLLVNGQDRQDSSCFSTLTDIKQRCLKNCITFNIRLRCYMCKEGCVDDSTSSDDSCDPSVSSSCESDEVCLATGITGRNTCVDRIEEGELCGRSYDGDGIVEDDDLTEKIGTDLSSGILERETISSIPEAQIPCRKGLVCKRESLDKRYCRLANTTACFRERLTDLQVSCDDKGNYEALQCRRTAIRLVCGCVSRNGTDIEGTETTVSSRSEAPDCENRKCSYLSRLGNLYQASSGSNFVDYRKCALCLCAAGEAAFCVSQRRDVCDIINPAPQADRSCLIRGRRVQDGESISIGCTRCRCSNGRIQCLKRVCEDDNDDDPVDEEDRRCLACRKIAFSPVCGNDGKTYPSACVANNCRGLSAGDVVPGPCNKKDVCVAYQCNDTEICLRRGGVTCLSRSGCRNAQHFRACVNLQNLHCNSNSSDDSGVCGSDGNSYSSICKLLQSAAGIRALYGNKCDAAQCSGGQVCGTDGETYSNICELQAQSANARVDYRGECMETVPDTVERDRCLKVRANGKCRDVTDCKVVIRPEGGCCPICGGGLTIGFDRAALEEFLIINPSVETVDDLMVRVFLSGFISEEDRNHCVIRGSLSSEGDLFIAFEAKVRSEDYCNTLAKRLENVINNPPMNDTASVSTSLPQEFQFATVAESSALFSEDTGPTTGGGRTVMKSISSFGIIVSLFLIALYV